MTCHRKKTVAIVVAHPDDETLWIGGTLLCNPQWECFILCMSRKNDPDRAPKFQKALKIYHADGIMADLDDGPEQRPIAPAAIARILADLLPKRHFDMIVTHNPIGEYTRHLRHEELGKTLMRLWISNKLPCHTFKVFAYTDHNGTCFPTAINNADQHFQLSKTIWKHKYEIITNVYGFGKNSWEAKTTPKTEAFYNFAHKDRALAWFNQLRQDESTIVI